MRSTRRRFGFVLAAVLAVYASGPVTAHAGRAAKISTDARSALNRLYRDHPGAKALGEKATAVLVFPRILKAGFMVGAQGGDGAMFKGGKTVAYYRSLAGSYGFQAGVQSFSYALFFMNESAMSYLNKSEGWEIGAGPSFVVVDVGMAKQLSSTTLTQDVYAFIFGQEGLMAGIGLQGSKITRIRPK
jgi:lipid-binding SYLF domain-containing protein